MPELPDVEIYKRLLDEHARGHVVSRVVVSDPKSLEHATGATLQRRLKGKRTSSFSRRGKVLFAVFEDAATLAMHFGPNGSLQDVSRDADEPASTRLLCPSVIPADIARAAVRHWRSTSSAAARVTIARSASPNPRADTNSLRSCVPHALPFRHGTHCQSVTAHAASPVHGTGWISVCVVSVSHTSGAVHPREAVDLRDLRDLRLRSLASLPWCQPTLPSGFD